MTTSPKSSKASAPAKPSTEAKKKSTRQDPMRAAVDVLMQKDKMPPDTVSKK